MPFANFHAARMADPGDFLKDSFRTKEIAPGIEIILGKRSEGGSMETQAYRFDKDKFSVEEAHKWLEEHKEKPILFEKASVGNISYVDNASDDEEGTWITVNGAHILIKDGENVRDAFKRTTGRELKGGETYKSKSGERYAESGGKVNRLSGTGEDVETPDLSEYHKRVAARKSTGAEEPVPMQTGGKYSEERKAHYEALAKADPEHYIIASGPRETSQMLKDVQKMTSDPDFYKKLAEKQKADKAFWKSIGIGNLAPIDNAGSFALNPHDVTLQRLDTYIPYSGSSSGKLKYAINNFEGTEGEWDRALAVFVPPGVPAKHVDHAAFARDPHGEARKLGFRIAGHHAGTRVISNGPGEPQLETKVIFDLDPEAEKLASEYKLSLSTGFDAEIGPDGSSISGKVRPNHVLYFLRNGPTAFGSPAAPNDLGARINNLSEPDVKEEKSVNNMTDDAELKDTLSVIKDYFRKENPMKAQLDNMAGE